MMPDTGWRELTACGWDALCVPEPQSILRATASLLTPVPHPGNVYGSGRAAENIIRAVANAGFSPTAAPCLQQDSML
jgi:UDP-N-acetylglucosamine 2-epimerase